MEQAAPSEPQEIRKATSLLSNLGYFKKLALSNSDSIDGLRLSELEALAASTVNAQQLGTSDGEQVLTALVLAHCWSAHALGQGRQGAQDAHERTSAMLCDIPKDVLLATRAPLALLRADVLSSYARYVSRLSGVGGSGGASCNARCASSGGAGGAGGSGGPHQAAAPHSRDTGAAAAVLNNILCVVFHLLPVPTGIIVNMAGRSDGEASGSSSAPGSQQSSSEPPAQQQQQLAELLDALGRSQLLEHAAAAVLRLAAACPPPPPPPPTAAAAVTRAGTVPPRHPLTSEEQTAAAAAAADEALLNPWLHNCKAAVTLCNCLQFVLVPAVASKRRVQQEDMSQQPNGTTAASSPAAAAADAVASSGVLDNSRLIAAQAGIQLASGPCTQYFALWLAGCARASMESLVAAAGNAGGGRGGAAAAAAAAAVVGAVDGSTGACGTTAADALAANRQSPLPSPRREVPTTGAAGLAPPLRPLITTISGVAAGSLESVAISVFLRVFQATVGVGGGPRIIGSQPLHQPASQQQQQQQPLRCRRLGITTPYPPVAVYAFLERHHNAFWTAGQSTHFAPIAEPLTTRWTPLMRVLLSQLRPEQAAARLPGLWRLLVVQLGGAKIEAATAGQVYQLLKHPRAHPAGSPPPPSQPRTPVVTNAATAADAATAAEISDPWPRLSARCALDAGLLPALERALRRPQLWPEAADCDPMLRTAETAAVLDLMTRGLRRSGAWPALVAHAPVHEVVGLVATVELLLKRTCPGTAWLRCLPPAFNQAVPEDARLLSNTVVALLEQLVAVCGADVLEPRPPQQQQQPPQRQQPQQPQPLPLSTSRLLPPLRRGRRALVKIIRSSKFPLLVLMSLLLVVKILKFLEHLLLLVALSEQQPGGWAPTAAETAAARQQLQLQQPEPSAAPAGSTEKHDDEVAMAAAAETVTGRENSTSSARGENQVDRRSGAASRRPQQPSTVLVGRSTSSMEEFEDLAAMAGPLWYNNIDQQRSRDRMRLADLVAAGGAPPAGSAAAAQQALLASFALQRWLPLLLEHASCAAFVAPPGVPVPVINGLSWTLAHRLAVVRLLLCLVRHVPDCMAARDEAQDAEEASAARLASESWHAALWGPCRTSTYGLVRNLLEGPAGPDDTEWPQGKAGEELELACLHLVEALIASRLWVPRPEAALSSGSDGGSNDRLVRKLRLLADRHGRHHLVDHLDATGQALEAQARSAAGLGLSGTEDNSPVMEGLLNVDPQQQPRPAMQQQMRAGSRLSWLLSPAEVEARLRKAGVVVGGVSSIGSGSGGAAAASAGAGAFKLCGNPECSSLDGPSALIAPGRGKTCARCRRVTYCCGACQLQHWREGGHDKACAGLAAAGAGAAAAAGAGAAAAGSK